MQPMGRALTWTAFQARNPDSGALHLLRSTASLAVLVRRTGCGFHLGFSLVCRSGRRRKPE